MSVGEKQKAKPEPWPTQRLERHSFFWSCDNYVGNEVFQNSVGGEMEMTE